MFSESCQTSKIKRFAKIANGYKALAVFAKHPILDVWQGSECASASGMCLLSHDWLSKLVWEWQFF